MSNTPRRSWIKAIIRTNVTDHDTDHKGRPRTIRKGTVGVVRGYLSGHYDISWNGGGWTRWTRAELARDAVVLMWGARNRRPVAAAGTGGAQ